MYNLYKDVVINNSTNYPVTVYDGTGAVVADTDAMVITADHVLSIRGFGNFKASTICAVEAQRGINSRVRIDTMTVATLAQWTVVAPSINTTVLFKIKARVNNYSSENTRYEMQFGKDLIYAVTATPADTATTLAAKLLAAATDRQTRFPESVNVTISLGGGTTVAPTSLVFTGADEHVTWTYSAEEEFDTTSSVVTVWAPAVTQTRFEGIQTATFMQENVRLLTNTSTRPYGVNNDELAVSGGLYNSFTFETVTDRPELKGFSVAGQVNQSKARFTVYALDSLTTDEGVQDQIINFLDKAATLNSVTAYYYGNVLTSSTNTGEAMPVAAGVAFAAWKAQAPAIV
jgi:hypothetical protein